MSLPGRERLRGMLDGFRRLQLAIGYASIWWRLLLPVPAGLLLAVTVALPLWLGLEFHRDQLKTEIRSLEQDRSAFLRRNERRDRQLADQHALESILLDHEYSLPDPSTVLAHLRGTLDAIELQDWRIEPLADGRQRYRTRWSGALNSQEALLQALSVMPWAGNPVLIDWSVPGTDNEARGFLSLQFVLIPGQPPKHWPVGLNWPVDDREASGWLEELAEAPGEPALRTVSLARQSAVHPGPEPATVSEQPPADDFSDQPVDALTYLGFLSAGEHRGTARALVEGQGEFAWISAARTVGRNSWIVESVTDRGMTIRHPDSGRIAFWTRGDNGPAPETGGDTQ